MATLFSIFWVAILVVHALLFVGALAQPLRRRARADRRTDATLPPVSIVVPVRGDRADLYACLTSLTCIDYPDAELVFCVGDDADMALPTVRAVIDASKVPAQCVIGRPEGFKSDKLRLVANGYGHSRHPIVLMTDDNMLWRGAVLRDLVTRLDGDVGLVSGVTTATGADTVWGQVDQAMINGYFNKLMLVGDLLGVSHATGKILLFRRADLDAAGGMDALNEGVCEDAVLREKLEARGLRAVLSPIAAEHPVAGRTFLGLWHRHLRWFRCRRAHSGLMFWLEPLISMAALAIWSVLWGLLDTAVSVWPTLAIGIALWLGLEAAYLALKRLPLSAWCVPAALLRELCFPILWVQCLTRESIDWRGNAFQMATGETSAP